MGGAVAHEGDLVLDVPIRLSPLPLLFNGAAGTIPRPPTVLLSKFPNTSNRGHLTPAEPSQHLLFNGERLATHVKREKRVLQDHLPDGEDFGGKLRADLAKGAVGEHRT